MRHISASMARYTGLCTSLLVLALGIFPLPAQAFDSGTTGANGPIPPAAIPGGTTDMVIDLRNGEVIFVDSAGAQIGSA